MLYKWLLTLSDRLTDLESAKFVLQKLVEVEV